MVPPEFDVVVRRHRRCLRVSTRGARTGAASERVGGNDGSASRLPPRSGSPPLPGLAGAIRNARPVYAAALQGRLTLLDTIYPGVTVAQSAHRYCPRVRNGGRRVGVLRPARPSRECHGGCAGSRVSVSAVSRRLVRLEDRLGVRLVNSDDETGKPDRRRRGIACLRGADSWRD